MLAEVPCLVCGYSRRGLRSFTRCPECGEEPPDPATPVVECRILALPRRLTRFLRVVVALFLVWMGYRAFLAASPAMAVAAGAAALVVLHGLLDRTGPAKVVFGVVRVHYLILGQRQLALMGDGPPRLLPWADLGPFILERIPFLPWARLTIVSRAGSITVGLSCWIDSRRCDVQSLVADMRERSRRR
jgi:hypothetical protein